MNRLWPLCLLGLLLVFAAPVGAETLHAPVFFEALYDVPVMPGLEEVKDQAMLFDKPDGRIASVVAASKTLNASDITRFYDESLPQLGWKKTSQNQYVRGSDRLVMDLTKTPPLTVVHFTLAPAR
jgi:hypothetical protein